VFWDGVGWGLFLFTVLQYETTFSRYCRRRLGSDGPTLHVCLDLRRPDDAFHIEWQSEALGREQRYRFAHLTIVAGTRALNRARPHRAAQARKPEPSEVRIRSNTRSDDIRKT
jgi:hypothetical protein